MLYRMNHEVIHAETLAIKGVYIHDRAPVCGNPTLRIPNSKVKCYTQNKPIWMHSSYGSSSFEFKESAWRAYMSFEQN